MEKDFWLVVGRHHHVILAVIVFFWILLATISPVESSASENTASVVSTQKETPTLFSSRTPSPSSSNSPLWSNSHDLVDRRSTSSEFNSLVLPKLAPPRPATSSDLSFHVKSASINRPHKASEPWEVLLTLQVRNESDAAVEFDPRTLLVQMGNASARTPEDVIPVRISANRPVMVPVSVSYSGRPSPSYRISYRGTTVVQGTVSPTLR